MGKCWCYLITAHCSLLVRLLAASSSNLQLCQVKGWSKWMWIFRSLKHDVHFFFIRPIWFCSCHKLEIIVDIYCNTLTEWALVEWFVILFNTQICFCCETDTINTFSKCVLKSCQVRDCTVGVHQGLRRFLNGVHHAGRDFVRTGCLSLSDSLCSHWKQRSDRWKSRTQPTTWGDAVVATASWRRRVHTLVQRRLRQPWWCHSGTPSDRSEWFEPKLLM